MSRHVPATLSTSFVGLMIALVLLPTMSGCGNGTQQNDNQVVRYGAYTAKIRGLDPMDIGDTTSTGMASNFYECLYEYHYLKRPYEIIPSLAASMPVYSSDRKTLTIAIRQDVFFHDNPCFPDGKGRQLEAADFVYSWKRLAYLKNTSKNWWILENHIIGLDAFRKATQDIAKDKIDYSQPVEGLQAIDRFTLQIKLTKPWPAIEYALSHLPLAAVPHEAVEKYGPAFQNHAVGTGAFMLKSWVRGSRIVMQRNPTFRPVFYPSEGEQSDEENGLLVDAGKRLPLIDRAEYQLIAEDNPYWLSFLSGNLDAAGIPKDNFSAAIGENFELSSDMQAKGIELTKYAEPTTFWLAFNMQDPVVGQNLALRQAMSLAFDAETFIALFTNNRSTRAHGPLPPMVSGYDENLSSPFARYDLALAKVKLKEARVLHRKNHGSDLPMLTLSVGQTDTTAIQMGTFYKRCFAAIGLKVQVDHTDWPTFQNKIKTKSAQMFTMGWIMDWPDAENMLLLWYGPNGSPGANNMNYQNDPFDLLYEKITVMGPSAQRTQLLQQMQQMVVDDLPCVFTTHRISFYLCYKWYKNYKPHVFGYGLMKYRNIDVALRRQMKGR